MVEIADVNYRYDDIKDIINNLSLQIPKWSCTAIVGNSGCGKTTLLNLIAGILEPNKGDITVHTDNFAYLMQDVTLLPYKTAFENVLLAYSLRNKIVNEDVRLRAFDLLQLFHIGKESFSKFPDELSGGMRQRIGLAQTLLTDPELLLLDEPFNAIDVNALDTIEPYLWNYVKKTRRTMVFITHNIEQALLLSDRIVIMGNNYITRHVLPSNDFIALSPAERKDSPEYKSLFFDIIEKMKL